MSSLGVVAKAMCETIGAVGFTAQLCGQDGQNVRPRKKGQETNESLQARPLCLRDCLCRGFFRLFGSALWRPVSRFVPRQSPTLPSYRGKTG